jgi:hypothetical protein
MYAVLPQQCIKVEKYGHGMLDNFQGLREGVG